MTTVRLTIRTLPELPYGAKYRCVFGSAHPIDATVTDFGLSCPTPDVNSRPHIPASQDHVLVPLSVRSSETNKDFVSRNFAYYDCSRHVTCVDCVKSQWACNWCVYENKCTHNTSSCPRTVIISGESVSILCNYCLTVILWELIYRIQPTCLIMVSTSARDLEEKTRIFFYRTMFQRRWYLRLKIYHILKLVIPAFSVSQILKVLKCLCRPGSIQTNLLFVIKPR